MFEVEFYPVQSGLLKRPVAVGVQVTVPKPGETQGISLYGFVGWLAIE